MRLNTKQNQLSQAQRLGQVGAPDVDRLAHEIEILEQVLSREREVLRGAKADLLEIVGSFPSSDRPQELVEQLNDAIPFVLFPVRIETRFMEFHGSPELWVRLFPDDMAVHTHETTLTPEEVQDGVTYWQAVWKAQQVADPAEQDKQKQGAWRALADGYGAQRASWIASETEPDTLDVSDIDDLQFPTFDEETLKPDAWSRAPRTNVMPDRFVVMTFSGGELIHEKVGRVVPDPLFLGPNPQQFEDGLAQRGGDIQLGDDIKILNGCTILIAPSTRAWDFAFLYSHHNAITGSIGCWFWG